MRRMSIISPVLHIFVSSLRLKHRMSLIQSVLYGPGLVDYFSYPHHGQKVRKIFLSHLKAKTYLKDEESQKFRGGHSA